MQKGTGKVGLVFIFIFSLMIIQNQLLFSLGKKDTGQDSTFATSEELSKQNNNTDNTTVTDDSATKTTDATVTGSNNSHTANATVADTNTTQATDTTVTEGNTSQTSDTVATETAALTANSNVILSSIQSLEVPLCPATKNSNTQIKGHEVHAYTGFELCYREDYEVAEWVSYTLTKEECNAVFERTNNFRSDTKISTLSATPQDYTKSGYDRGHLAPAADMEWSAKSVSDSFLMSNMTPQEPQFNRGLWKTLEEAVRTWAKTFGEVFVATGPVLEKPASEYKTIGQNKVAVPEYFYKVLLAQLNDSQNTIIGIGFILPNTKCEGTIYDYAVSIDEVEKRTGIDFYSALPDKEENVIEASKSLGSWK